jgi:hypothetical protein
MNIDRIALESAFLDRNPERSYWLDRETGKVLVADAWSKEQVRKLSSPGETGDPHVRLAWCVLWENGEVGSDEPSEEERARVRAVMEPLVSIPWYGYPDEDRLQRNVDNWLERVRLLEEPDED